jgi:hypothetical protein
VVFLVAAVVVLVIVAGGVIVVTQSSFGHGLGAAAAIYEHGKPQVFRTNYRETTGQAPTMDVFLAVGVDPVDGITIGCGVVDRELTTAGLASVHWVVYTASGEAVADSKVVTCP